MRQARKSFIFAAIFLVLTISESSAHNFSLSEDEKRESKILTACKTGAWGFFAKNSPAISDEHETCLEEVKLLILQNTGSILVIDGHHFPDERKGISLTRANFARDYLVEERGMDAARIIVRNFSYTCPQAKAEPRYNTRNEYWLLTGGTTIDDITKIKECADCSTPKVITDEKPAPWKKQRYFMFLGF